jgi:Holliday junction DNA helicase RuvB
MTFAEIMADVIRTTLAGSSITTAERILFRNYDEDVARRIVSHLLSGPPLTARVNVPEDAGVHSVLELPASTLSAGAVTLEIIPFVVVKQPCGSDPRWCGSQGFASRLRTAFASHDAPGISRILILFDESPVETEQTTASGLLARGIESFDTLLEWLNTPQWQAGFVPDVYSHAIQLLRWFQDRLAKDPRWTLESHERVWERAVSFVEACRRCNAKEDIGAHLQLLGVFFRDDALFSDRWLVRIEENAVLASRLEVIRRNRVLDPLAEADAILDLGSPADAFHDRLLTGLRSSRSVTDVAVTYEEVASRLRTREQRPAWLDIAHLECRALDDLGEPQEPPLEWRLLGSPTLPPQSFEPIDLVVPSPPGGVELTFPLLGDLRAFLFKSGVFFSTPGEVDGALVPGNSLTLSLNAPNPCEVVELLIRERLPGRGRAPRATQVVRIALVAGSDAVCPEGATLDAEHNCFRVDGSLDSLLVQVGQQEVRVGDELPPTSGSPVEVTVAGAQFRWAGEDRSPSDQSVSSPVTIRLIEQLGLRTGGDPTTGRPLVLGNGQLGAVYRTTAALDVSESLMHEESQLLHAPTLFAGVDEDNEAAESHITNFAPTEFNAWIKARVAFFESVIESSTRRLGGGHDCHSVYLVDLRDPVAGGLADLYVSSYTALLLAAAKHSRTNANQALIEPLLFCDRTFTADDALRLGPTHPAAVALLATLQRGLLTTNWPDDRDSDAIQQLLRRPLLSGALPWAAWRGKALTAIQSTPLLWRAYGTDGGRLDTSQELAPVIFEKVKRFLSLAPHLNHPEHTVFINIEVGQGTGDYILEAVLRLEGDDSIRCGFDLAVVAPEHFSSSALVRLFARNGAGQQTSLRETLQGFVRVRSIADAAAREAHLVFRMEAARSERLPFSSMSEHHPLARNTGFSAGLSIEAARFADSASNEVVYTRYVALPDPQAPVTDGPEGLWNGPSRSRYISLCAVMQHASIGLHNSIALHAIPTQSLRQIADSTAARHYQSSFITVHCDPAQGPEFFVGDRTSRSGVFLVECSDRGSPQLPGRDIVSVTSRIAPFRAALASAVSGLPAPLNGLVNADVAKGLLRDINLLRGTEVFDFLREISQANHIHLMDGLDNVLALRFLLSKLAERDDFLPLVVSMKDLTDRSPLLRDLRKNDKEKSDDIIVIYLPRNWTDTPALEYRLVEVKFGARRQQWSKAQQQLSSTAQRLAERLPLGIWKDDPSAVPLMLERDLAWVIHETLERYRAFGLLGADADVERYWRLKDLFERLHAGGFIFAPYRPSDDPGDPINGTALMLDPSIPGANVTIEIENATEYVTIPSDVVAHLLVNLAAHAAASPTDTPVHLAYDGSGVSRPSDTSEEREPCNDIVDPASSAEQDVPHSGRGTEAAVSHSDALLLRSPAAPLLPANPAVSTAPIALDGAVAPHLQNTANSTQAREDATANVQSQINAVFEGFIGNDGAVTRLKRFITIARLECRRALDPVGLFGPASTGKTELARRIATAMNLPTLELSETTLKSADDLAEKIHSVAQSHGTPLRMLTDPIRGTILAAPAMVVFIDEVHLLRGRVQESLLKALEPDDRTLLSNLGTIDTSDVTFVIATTDPGDLGSAFKSRIVRFDLHEYTTDEIVAILRAHRESRDDLPMAASQLGDDSLKVLATVGRLIPRRAIGLLKETAREVSVGLLSPSAEALLDHFWTQLKIDQQGLTETDRRYLRLLFPDRTVGVDSLAAQLGDGQSTISEDIEPYLLRLGLIERARGGRRLTRAGRELAVRYP